MRLPCTCDFHGSRCSLRAGEFPRKEPRGSLHAAGCSQGLATRPLPGGRADLGSLGVSCGSGLLVCLGDRRTRYGLVWQGPSRDAPGHVTPTSASMMRPIRRTGMVIAMAGAGDEWSSSRGRAGIAKL